MERDGADFAQDRADRAHHAGEGLLGDGIASRQRGIGVKWTTGAITREQRLYDVLGIDSKAERIVGFFWYGRPQVVPTKERRPVAEIVVELP